MEVHVTPETAKKLNDLAAASGRAPEEIVEDALAGYLDHVASVRETLDSRYDERFRRLWRYYLLTCAGSFRARRRQSTQLKVTPPTKRRKRAAERRSSTTTRVVGSRLIGYPLDIMGDT